MRYCVPGIRIAYLSIFFASHFFVVQGWMREIFLKKIQRIFNLRFREYVFFDELFFGTEVLGSFEDLYGVMLTFDSLVVCEPPAAPFYPYRSPEMNAAYPIADKDPQREDLWL